MAELQLTIHCLGLLEQNDVAESRNWIFMDMVRSITSTYHLPKSLWGEALKTVAYILNRVPSKSFSKIPFELWTCKKLVSIIFVFVVV